MKKFGEFICKNKLLILIITLCLLIPSFIGMNKTKINYDILVYLPSDIDTVEGQNILADDFNMGAFSVTVLNNMSGKDILNLENKIKEVNGVANVVSAYDVVGTTIPIEYFPDEVVEKVNKGDSDLLLITFTNSTSDEVTLNAIKEIKEITDNSLKIGGMSSMVLDTMNLSETEIMIYIVIAVLLCILVLELSLDSYVVPFILLLNIGIAILFNLGSNIIFGDISYITKALVAVLQLGVTTDFSIFLYHAYEKNNKKNKIEAMSEAINETFTSVIGSSLTTIAGFLVLCTMSLTLGKDLGLVMAKGVFLGVVCVLTIFPSLLLFFDNIIDKTRHKCIMPKFNHLNRFVIKYNKLIFLLFIVLLIPAYLGYSKVDVYYKLDKSLPDTLDSITANKELKEKFNIVSPEIIIIDKNIKTNDINNMINEIKDLDGIDMVLSASKLKEVGIANMLSDDVIKIFESDKYQMILVNSIYDIATDELNGQVIKVDNIIKKYDEHAILAGEGPLMKDLVSTSNTDFNNVNTYSIVCILLIMFIVLKSISLPILLTLSIEFAIFINMAIPYFNGSILPFVAPIVLGTIQLGATIDYAILLTTTYLNNRNNGMKKNKAMEETLNNCTNSIFVSGMCFFAATFGVGIYSKLEMISSLCTLISRGAIISMLVVILVLPSILLIFDKIICKTTYGIREDKMKNYKKTILTLLIISISLISTPVFALTKSETIYTKLNGDGSVKNTVITNHLKNLENETDISDLENIININGNETFTQDNYNLNWNSSDDIFYQGTINKKLPIGLDITYKLNGEDIKLDDLIGKSGKVTINLKYINYDSHNVRVNRKNETLYTPFVVTMGTIINNGNNVSVSNGTIADSGNKKIIIGIASPGLYESLNVKELKNIDTVTISYDTDSFELNSIYSVSTPKLISNDDLKVFNKLNTLYSSMNTLSESMNKISEGSKKLLDGSLELSEGSKAIYENLSLISSKLPDLETGTIGVDEGLTNIITALQASVNAFDSSKITEMQNLILSDTNTINTLTTTNNGLKAGYDAYGLRTKTESELSSDLITLKRTYEGNENLITLLTYNKTALTSSLTSLNDINTELNELITNLTTVQGYTSTIASSTTTLKNGISLLTSKTSEFNNGVQSMHNGVNELNSGINKFNEEGITPLNNMVNTDLKSIQNKIEALTKLGNDYKYSMGVNKDSKFVLVVDSVKKEKTIKNIEIKAEKTSLWTRIKNLFK